MCLMLGAAEVVSRCWCAERMAACSPRDCLLQGMASLKAEVVDADEFNALLMDNHLITAAMPLIDRHALNATDAVILRLAATSPPNSGRARTTLCSSRPTSDFLKSSATGRVTATST